LPYHFSFDSKHGILRCRVEGHVTNDVMKEYYRVAADYFSQICPLKGLFDFTGVTSFEISPRAIRGLANLPPVMPDPSRIEVVVAHTYTMYALARMFQFEGRATRPNLHVVRWLREAWTLLGVQHPHFEPCEQSQYGAVAPNLSAPTF
jgi:hypothetical protein